MHATSNQYPNTPRWIGGDEDRFILASLFEIRGHRLKGEPLTWTITKSNRRSDPDPENNNPIRQTITLDDDVIVLFDNGHIQRLHGSTDSRVWEQTLEPKPAGGVSLDGTTMTYLARSKQGESIHVFDSATGKRRSAYNLPRGDAVLDQFPGEATTVLQTADGFIGIHSQMGQQSWRIGGQSRLSEGHAVADSSGIYASVDGQQVVKFSRETGERVWRFEGIGVNPPARVTMSVNNRFILVRSGGFLQVLDSTNGMHIGRVECLGRERIHVTGLLNETLYALVKPIRKESMWRLEVLGLSGKASKNRSDKHYFLPSFPDFNEATMIGDTIVVHDGNRVLGFKLPRRQATGG
ncbi:MAG: hypothetical protein DHS20C16_29760 [Phycisphaerae bacterium]|nr:MAG: hypothetical protein DHS20C16_29760 [Phycisphaerae bacterium]